MTRSPARRRTSTLVYLARFVFGLHLDGRARSDASFFRRGLERTEPHWLGQRAAWWSLLAGWHRAAIRLGGVALAVGLLWWRQQTEWAAVLVLAPLTGWGLVRTARRMLLARHTRTIVRPLASALSPYLGVSPLAVEAGLDVRPDYVDADGGEHVAALILPDHWAATTDQRRQVQEVISARFGAELRYQWRTSAYPMVVNATRAPVPPAVVPFASVEADMAALPASKVLLGRGPDGGLHYWDRSTEDPHMAVHGGSRRGKTSLLLSIAAQELARGGRVTAIDPKWVGLAPLAGLPGMTLLRDPRDVPAMWAGIEAFHAMIQERFEALSHDPTIEFGYELLIVDEVSMFASITQRTWRAGKTASDPALAPVWDQLAGCVWLGAQVRAHVVVAGQRLDYAILGGMLGSFGVRMLAGYGPQDYARLVGVPPFLRSQKPRGRFLVYAGGDLTWLQLVKSDDPDGDYTGLRDFALRGALAAAEGPPDLGAPAGTETSGSGELVGLGAAAAHLGMGAEAFRKARQRHPVPGERTGPDGRTPAWPAAALTAWRESRSAAARSTR
jgi:hypothetical protein